MVSHYSTDLFFFYYSTDLQVAVMRQDTQMCQHRQGRRRLQASKHDGWKQCWISSILKITFADFLWGRKSFNTFFFWWLTLNVNIPFICLQETPHSSFNREEFNVVDSYRELYVWCCFLHNMLSALVTVLPVLYILRSQVPKTSWQIKKWSIR